MEKYKEIERSIIKTYRKEIWSKFIKAVKNYQLIQENDKIMVCISGGKDSFLMAKCIQELQRYGRVPFEAHYVVMDPGYNSYNRDFIEDNADLLNVPIEIFESIISWRKHNDLTFINCACRFTEGCSLINDGTSKRKEVKELIKTIKQVNPNVDQNIFKALDNVNLDCILGMKKDKAYHSFLKDYEK